MAHSSEKLEAGGLDGFWSVSQRNLRKQNKRDSIQREMISISRERRLCLNPRPVPLIQEVDVPLYSAGDRVSQTQYGDGTVTNADEYHTVIEFDAHGPRTFATRIVQLARTSTPAPPKPVKSRRRSVKLA